MAQISITDTGYLKTDNSGTRLSTANRANSGSKITLKGVKINFTRLANLNVKPVLGTYDDVDVDMIGFDNAGLMISGKLDMTDTTERTYVGVLNELVKTRGWKAIFYDSSTSSNEDTQGQLIYQIANSDGATVTATERTEFGVTGGSTVKHFCMYFKSISIEQSATNRKFVNFRLVGHITKKHTAS